MVRPLCIMCIRHVELVSRVDQWYGLSSEKYAITDRPERVSDVWQLT